MGAKTVIKFYATWCGPCKAYDTTWNKVKEELSDRFKFMEIDVDKDTSGLAAKYNIRSIPATIVLNNCLLYTSPSPRDRQKSRMPSSA